MTLQEGSCIFCTQGTVQEQLSSAQWLSWAWQRGPA